MLDKIYMGVGGVDLRPCAFDLGPRVLDLGPGVLDLGPKSI